MHGEINMPLVMWFYFDSMGRIVYRDLEAISHPELFRSVKVYDDFVQAKTFNKSLNL